jgi:SAM-dependent methyltransferase
MNTMVFDQEVDRYDAWYDTPKGAGLFRVELEALRPVISATASPRLEVGVGTGRFAGPLGIGFGVDVAMSPLRLARERGISVAVAPGEALPFHDETFGCVVFIFTLCFVDSPSAVVQEAARVLQPGGLLVLGLVPASGPLGLHYQRRAALGYRIYESARFFGRAEIFELLRAPNLEPGPIRSAPMEIVDDEIVSRDPSDGDHPGAGFLVIGARKR